MSSSDGPLDPIEGYVEGILKENLINLRAESLDNLELITRTPSSALRSVRKK